MKKLLLLFVLVGISCRVPVSAQVKGLGFGPRVGVNLADYINSGGKSRAGLHAGGFIDYHFTNRWAVETGVYYSEIGCKDVVEAGYGKSDFLLNYVTVPLVGSFNFLGGFRVMLGMEGMFRTSAYRKMEGMEGKQKIDYIRNSNLTVHGGVGYLVGWGLDITATYSKGLYSTRRDISKSTNPTFYRITVGWRFIGTRGKVKEEL